MRSSRRSASVPARLDRVRRELEDWRASGQGRRIPEKLWRAAVEVARETSVYRTARALRLNYEYLKRRTESRAERRKGGASAPPAPPFIELLPNGIGGSQGVAELEGSAGRMRVEWRGAMPDLGALGRSLFGGEGA